MGFFASLMSRRERLLILLSASHGSTTASRLLLTEVELASIASGLEQVLAKPTSSSSKSNTMSTCCKSGSASSSSNSHPTETLQRVAGKFAGKSFHVPDGSWEKAELAATLDRLDEDDRIFFYDSFGSTEWETVSSTIRFLAHAEGIRLFYVDNLTALAAGSDKGETEALEEMMAAVAMLAKELSVIIHLVSHLSTPEGKPHEEGGRVMIRHFKGSRAIGFWCNFMFGMERDQQNADRETATLTTFRILKDRLSGRSTGQSSTSATTAPPRA